MKHWDVEKWKQLLEQPVTGEAKIKHYCAWNQILCLSHVIMQSIAFFSKKHIIRSDSRRRKAPWFSESRIPSFPAHPYRGLRHYCWVLGFRDFQVEFHLRHRSLGKGWRPWIFTVPETCPHTPSAKTVSLPLGKLLDMTHSIYRETDPWRAEEMQGSGLKKASPVWQTPESRHPEVL